MARADCPTCHGSGWKIVERNANGAQALSADRPGAASAGEPKLVWAVPCDCTSGDRSERALAKARVPERYRHHDFDNFETDNDEFKDASPEQIAAWNRSLTQAKLIVRRLSEEYSPLEKSYGQGLLLMGPCGTGKTHLAVAALKSIMARVESGLFYDYGELLKEIQASYSPTTSTTEWSVLQPVLNAEVLVLDDLGFSKPSDWALETVAHILGTRYNANRLTIVTTNYLDPEFQRRTGVASGSDSSQPRVISNATDSRTRRVVQLPSGEYIAQYAEDTLEQRVGKRIRSRLYEMCRTVEIHAADYRKEIRNISRA